MRLIDYLDVIQGPITYSYCTTVIAICLYGSVKLVCGSMIQRVRIKSGKE